MSDRLATKKVKSAVSPVYLYVLTSHSHLIRLKTAAEKERE